MPRQLILGRAATGGSVVWAFTYGFDERDDQFVELGDLHGELLIVAGQACQRDRQGDSWVGCGVGVGRPSSA